MAGGRPRVRTGDEVQVTVEFPLREYAQLSGYVHLVKQRYATEGRPISAMSKRNLLMQLWHAYWQSLSPTERRGATSAEAYRRERARRGK